MVMIHHGIESVKKKNNKSQWTNINTCWFDGDVYLGEKVKNITPRKNKSKFLSPSGCSFLFHLLTRYTGSRHASLGRFFQHAGGCHSKPWNLGNENSCQNLWSISKLYFLGKMVKIYYISSALFQKARFVGDDVQTKSIHFGGMIFGSFS